MSKASFAATLFVGRLLCLRDDVVDSLFRAVLR
jgi:hypothetical protein